MKNKLIPKSTFLLGIFALMFSMLSCHQLERHTYEEYIIKVDSIQVPDTLNLGAKMPVTFFGTIGNNGCSSFSRFFFERNAGKYTIYVIGKRMVGENLVCPEILPMLNETLNLLADSQGTIRLEIVNPGVNQLLVKNVFIRP